MRSLTLVLLGAGLLGLVLACHVAVGDGDTPEVMANDQGVWYRADVLANKDTFGQTIKAPKGALVDVTLAENATTGYSWHCTVPSGGNIMVVRSTFAPPTTGMIGAGGTRHFLLLVSGTGKTVVTLQYGQWWDGGTKQSPQTFTVDSSAASRLGFQ